MEYLQTITIFLKKIEEIKASCTKEQLEGVKILTEFRKEHIK